MDFPAVKRSLEKAAVEILPTPVLDALPSKFYEVFILYGLSVDLIEPGRLLCSMAVPSRLLNSGNFLHGGATISLIDIVGSAAFYTVGARSTGSPLEMSTSFLDSAFVHALDTFNTAVVSPIYYVMFTTLTILASVIMFKDWDRQNPTQIVTEMCGFVTILSGTFLLHKTKDMADGTVSSSLSLRLPKHANEAGYQNEGIPLRFQEPYRSP